jgi:hypothetical protein
MPSQLIQFRLIDPNPFRDFARNPMGEAQLDQLAASIDATSFWANCLVRQHGRRYQLGYGHMRLEAAKRAGIREAEFQVRILDDDAMLRVMFAENVTQFGKDAFATYQEATVAAVTQIMAKVLAGQRALLGSPDRDGQLVAEIKAGGAPGEDTVRAYLGGGSLRDIRTALQLYRDSGELAAWHAQHNPQAKPPEPPTVSPEAVAQFRRSHHVKAFVDAVKVNQIPVAQQPAYAERVIAQLTDNRPPAKRGSTRPEGFDDTVPPDERLTAVNIRRKVEQQVMEEPGNRQLKTSMLAMQRMTTLEAALEEIWRGGDRAVRGFGKLSDVIAVLGGVDTEMSATARFNLQQVREMLVRFDRIVAWFKGNEGRPGNGTGDTAETRQGRRALLRGAP